MAEKVPCITSVKRKLKTRRGMVLARWKVLARSEVKTRKQRNPRVKA